MPVPLLPYGFGSVAGAATFPIVTVEMQFTNAGWTDITPYVDVPHDVITIQRGSTRVESPVIRYEGSTCSIPLMNHDRRFDPTNLAGPYVSGGKTQILPRIPVRVSATYQSLTWRLFTGYVDAWNISYAPPSDSVAAVDCSDGFRRLGAQPRAAKTTYGGGGEDAGARITRILDDGAWPPASRSITAGDATMQPTLLGGTTPGVVPAAVIIAGGGQFVNVAPSAATSAPLDELQLTADTEMGEFYIDGRGFAVFRHRNGIYLDSRSVTSQATFGDDPAVPTTELPYASAPLIYDMATLWNGATIANQGGNLQQAFDAASQAEPPDGYGPRVYDSQNLLADSDFQALNYAQHIVATSKNPELRFESITIDTAADPVNLFPQIRQRDIGDRITIKRRPPGGGAIISRDVFIRGVQHAITDSTWLTTWVLQDATSLPQPFILGDATNGVLGTSRLGF